jgi:hypothetical protein
MDKTGTGTCPVASTGELTGRVELSVSVTFSMQT